MRRTSHNQVALSYERFSGQTHLFWTTWDRLKVFLKVFPLSLLLTGIVAISLTCQPLSPILWKMLYGYSLLEEIIKLLKEPQDTHWKTALFLHKNLSGNGYFYLIYQISLYSVLIFLPKKNSHELTFMKYSEYPTISKIRNVSIFLNLI